MKNEDIYDGITNISDELVDGAEKHKFRKRKIKWIAPVAAVLAVAIIAGALLMPGGGGVRSNAYAIAEAEYPKMAQFPKGSEYNQKEHEEWYNDYSERREMLQEAGDYAANLDTFFKASISEFLSGANGKNKVYSPLNVYMALGMLAETTGGNSRQQILDLLNAKDIKELRKQASILWNVNYRNDGAETSILASSMWLNSDISFVQSTLDTLAETYYASSYSGEMGSEEFNMALRDWLNEQTGGLLEDSISGVEMEPNTIIALAATIYFQSKWADEFNKNLTRQDLFFTDEGETTCDFMYSTQDKNCYWGDNFTAVMLPMENRGGMWFVLPDEGVSPDSLLADSQAMEFIISPKDWENYKYIRVNHVIPKFDVTSGIDLIDGLKNLGVTDVFDSMVSDFTPLTKDSNEIFVSRASHEARVVIDEEGCTAVAYTLMMNAGGAPFSDDIEEIDFIVDRPFVFVITGMDGLPLFVGVVNHPTFS